MQDDPDLRARLAAFSFDEPGAAYPFSARLQRENGWSAEFAQRAIEEYRRFLYLACVAGRQMTPSEAVDAVWHLHLSYTRSYWDELCRKVLRRPLHHEPTSSGATEDSRFRDAYRATLACYEAAFGEAPPNDVWPDVEARFAPRLTASTYWRIPKAPFAKAAAFMGWKSAALVGVLGFSGAALAATPNQARDIVPWLAAGGVVLFAVGKWAWDKMNGTPGKKNGDGSSGCGGSSPSDSGSSHHGCSHGGSSDGGSGCSSGCGGGGD